MYTRTEIAKDILAAMLHDACSATVPLGMVEVFQKGIAEAPSNAVHR